jgi:hypothetical protein
LQAAVAAVESMATVEQDRALAEPNDQRQAEADYQLAPSVVLQCALSGGAVAWTSESYDPVSIVAKACR